MSTNRRQFKSGNAGEGCEAASDERRDSDGHVQQSLAGMGGGQNFVDVRLLERQ